MTLPRQSQPVSRASRSVAARGLLPSNCACDWINGTCTVTSSQCPPGTRPHCIWRVFGGCDCSCDG
ncbi:MAG: hypothetical protein MI919_28495 [Holophagales bacterium]|nr:hypothetical protein [Holophagales bacterium]